jgi:hypothetical protein
MEALSTAPSASASMPLASLFMMGEHSQLFYKMQLKSLKIAIRLRIAIWIWQEQPQT